MIGQSDFQMAPRDVQRDRIAGCLAGVMIGDAMGMPVETWKHSKIMTLNDGRGVIDFMPSKDSHFRAYQAGETTDDWQLTRAVLRSLIRTKGKLDIADVAAEHVAEWSPDRTTWGGSTHEAIRAIKDGERDPTVPLPMIENSEAGSGTGVMMKIAGLAVAHALRATAPIELALDCSVLGGLTHPDPIASIAAYAIAESIRHRMLRQPIDVFKIAATCGHMSSDYVFGPTLIRSRTWDADQRRGMPFRPFSALYCGVFSFATADALDRDFRAAILEAANAGGDTDSNASAIGAIIGASIGWSRLPHDWRSFSPAFAEALSLADQLIDAVTAD